MSRRRLTRFASPAPWTCAGRTRSESEAEADASTERAEAPDARHPAHATPARRPLHRRGGRVGNRHRTGMTNGGKLVPSCPSLKRPMDRTVKLRPSSLNTPPWVDGHDREFSCLTHSRPGTSAVNARREGDPREEGSPRGSLRQSPGYGRETVVLSPEAEMLKVPAAVEPVYA